MLIWYTFDNVGDTNRENYFVRQLMSLLMIFALQAIDIILAAATSSSFSFCKNPFKTQVPRKSSVRKYFFVANQFYATDAVIYFTY